MIRSKQGWGCLAAMALSAVMASDCFGDAKPNPYESIVDRNPFGLKPPPPPPDPASLAPPAAPPATVELTGITSIFQKHKALLEITPGPGKPVIKPILMEGERVESVEVVSINVEKNEVTIKNGNITTNLSLKVPNKTPGGATAVAAAGLQAAYPTTAPFNAAAPGVTPLPGAAATPTVFTPGNAGAGGSGRGGVAVFGANTATGASGSGSAVTTFGGQQAQPNTPFHGTGTATPTTSFGAGGTTAISTPGATSDPFRQIPPRIPRAQPQQQRPAEGQIDPAVQYINMRAQELQAQQKGIPFPPIPPIPGLDYEAK